MLVETIEVSMAEDGTYTLQECRESVGGRQVLRVVTDAPSIPTGLSMLASLIYKEAQRDFKFGAPQ